MASVEESDIPISDSLVILLNVGLVIMIKEKIISYVRVPSTNSWRTEDWTLIMPPKETKPKLGLQRYSQRVDKRLLSLSIKLEN